MSNLLLLRTETVALVCQIICFAVTEHSFIEKINVQILQTAQQVNSQYFIFSLSFKKNQSSEQQERSVDLNDLYSSDWTVDHQLFKQTIATFEKTILIFRKNISFNKSLISVNNTDTETSQDIFDILKIISQSEQTEHASFVWTDQL